MAINTTALYSAPVPESLDKSQQDFCNLKTEAVRLLAPAGSGKTLSLLWRCKTLAERSNKSKPRFLIFTFTRAAREELSDRIKSQALFENIAPLITISTLNSWGWKLVKNSTSNPRLIISRQEQYICIQNTLQPVWQQYPALKSLLEDNRRKTRAAKELLGLLDFIKSMAFRHDAVQDIEEVKAHLEYLFSSGMDAQFNLFYDRLIELEIIREGDILPEKLLEEFLPFWRDACLQMHSQAMFTLEDQKYWAWLELDNLVSENRHSTGAARYHHILVDEFQDINPLDLALLKTVAAHNKAALTLVGDDDQAIYEWRGATPDFILNPERHLRGAYTTSILAVNYRSPKNIVSLSQRLIAHNKRRVPKDVQASREDDALVEIRRYPSISESITTTVALVHELLNDPKINNVALVGRKRSQIIPYQIVFAGQNIPFYAAEDLQVLLSDAFDELKGMLVIRARAEHGGMFADDPIQALLRLCDKVKRFPLAKKDRESLKRFLYQRQPSTLEEATRALLQYSGPLKGDNVGGRMSAAFAAAIVPLLKSDSVSASIKAISENFDGLQKDYGKSLDDIFYADPPFLYLAEYAQRYAKDYQAFYADIEKAIATLARIQPDTEATGNEDNSWKLPLHLMTALRAKGKEFDAVIILDANDGIWPSKLAITDAQKEQERRLFYVAMTRARRALYFVVNDSMLGERSHASPYLAEMGMELT